MVKALTPFLHPSLSYSEKHPIGDNSYFFITYKRIMTTENFLDWKSKRNTGLRLSWSFDTETEREYKYREDNKYFIKLANLLHSSQNKAEIWREIREKRFRYLTGIVEEETCVGENLNHKKRVELMQDLFSLFSWVSNKPIFENQISAETLAEAQQMFYYLTRCPNYYETALVLRTFFYKLINNFPLKTILITIVRIFESTVKNKKRNEMMVANDLLRKLDEIIGLNIKNDSINLNSNQMDIVNHPVHIIDNRENFYPSAFIPFCSVFGSMEIAGVKIENFSLPVCRSFKKTLLDGQLCYQIDVNSFIEQDTMTTLQKAGLSILVDVNAEYERFEISSREEVKIFQDFTEEFIRKKESDKIMIHLDTISKTLCHYYSIYILLSNDSDT